MIGATYKCSSFSTNLVFCICIALNIIVLHCFVCIEKVKNSLAQQVKGGVIPSDYSGTMWSDVLIELDENYNKIWEWHSTDYLNVDRHPITFNDPRDEWSHGNTVVPIDNDKVRLIHLIMASRTLIFLYINDS